MYVVWDNWPIHTHPDVLQTASKFTMTLLFLNEYMRRYPHAFSGGQRQRIGTTRCPYVQENCKSDAPPLREVETGRFAACHYAEQLTLRGVVVD